jgi:hypothetical protein
VAVPVTTLGRRTVTVAVGVRVGIRVTVTVTVTVRVTVTVTVTVAVTVAVAVTVGVTVAVRVAVIIVTVVVAVARTPLAPVHTVRLDVPRDHRASFFRIDLADARVVHELGKEPALVPAGRRFWVFAVVRDARGQCSPSKRYALGFVATWLEAIETLFEHRGGEELTSAFTGRWLRLSAVLFDALL